MPIALLSPYRDPQTRALLFRGDVGMGSEESSVNRVVFRPYRSPTGRCLARGQFANGTKVIGFPFRDQARRVMARTVRQPFFDPCGISAWYDPPAEYMVGIVGIDIIAGVTGHAVCQCYNPYYPPNEYSREIDMEEDLEGCHTLYRGAYGATPLEWRKHIYGPDELPCAFMSLAIDGWIGENPSEPEEGTLLFSFGILLHGCCGALVPWIMWKSYDENGTYANANEISPICAEFRLDQSSTFDVCKDAYEVETILTYECLVDTEIRFFEPGMECTAWLES